MGMTGISKSQVSRLCGEIDERVNAFLSRPIEGDWPYVWIDATYVKVRSSGRIVSVAVIIAVGVNTDGSGNCWESQWGRAKPNRSGRDFLRSLSRRGLRGVKLVISDSHAGLKAAIAKVFKATWQRCRVHFMRNALAYAVQGSTANGPCVDQHGVRSRDSRSGKRAVAHCRRQIRERNFRSLHR